MVILIFLFLYLTALGISSLNGRAIPSSMRNNRFFSGLGYLLISSYFSCHCRVLWCIVFLLPVLSLDLYTVGSAPKQALENRVKVLHGGGSPRLTSMSERRIL